jgi:hypothetical protein
MGIETGIAMTKPAIAVQTRMSSRPPTANATVTKIPARTGAIITYKSKNSLPISDILPAEIPLPLDATDSIAEVDINQFFFA